MCKHDELHISIARPKIVHSDNSLLKHKTTKLHGDEKQEQQQSPVFSSLLL